MKKILLALTAAVSCAFFAKAEVFNFMGFEDLTVGNVLDANKDDAGGTGNAFWSYAANGGITECVVTNYEDGAAYGLYGAGNEALGQNAPGNNYLNVEASEAKLFRNVNYTGEAEAIGSGLYFDSLVQFSATDQSPEVDLTQDKLVVWLYGGDEDSTLYGATTNLVVTAAYLDDAANTVVETNYVVSVSGVTVMPGEWHRLTIKALNETALSGAFEYPVPGFVVFIDGKVATCTEAKGVEGSAMDLTKLNATAKNWFEKDALFPSLAYSKAAAQQITAVGFDGSGAIDDVCFTSTAPSFAADGMYFTLNWSVGVQSMTINGDAVTVDPAAEGTTNILVATAGSTYTVVATAASGYKVGTPTVDGGVTYAEGVFTVSGTGVGNIVMTPSNFKLNGSGDYATFAEAFSAAQNGDTISVANNVVMEGAVVDFNGKEIVLDLAGKTIETTKTTESTVNVGAQAKLTIISSVAGGKIVGACQDGAVYNGGTLIWGAAENDNGATLDGILFNDGSCSIVRGSFDKASNPLRDLNNLKADGTVITEAGDYYVVAPGEEPPAPTTYTLTVTPASNASYAAVDSNNVAIAFTENVATIDAGAAVTITATPAQGYTYEYVDLGTGWTLSGSSAVYLIGAMNANETVVIPTPNQEEAPPAQTVSVTITLGQNVTSAYYAVVADITSYDPQSLERVAVVSGVPFQVDATNGLMFAGAFFEDGYEIDEQATMQSLQGAEVNTQTGLITLTNSTASITIIAKASGGGDEYPTYISGIEDAEVKAAYQTKYNTWKTTYGADTESAYEAAFLLNIAPDAADKTLKPVSITVGADGVAIAANQALASVNGKVYVKSATTLAGLSTAEWVEATLDEGVIKVTPGASDTAGFYKIKVDF